MLHSNRWFASAIVAALVLVASPARASDWQQVAFTTSPDSIIKMDMASVRKRGAFVFAWVRHTYAEDQKNRAGQSYRSTLNLEAFNCSERLISTVQISMFSGTDGDGEVVSNQSRPRDTYEWVDISPDSIGEAQMTAACMAVKAKQ